MKKFLTAMMFALIVVFHSPSNVSAFYADGYHYFCTAIPDSSPDWNECYRANVYVIRNGVHQGGMTIQFGRNGGPWYYHIFNGASGFAPVSSNRFAQLVFEETHENVLWSRRKTPEEEAKELERQRLAEQKRREEEKKRLAAERERREAAARRNKFNQLIAAGDNAYTAKDYPVAIQNYKNARKLDKASVDKFFGALVKNGDDLNAQQNYLAALDYYKKAGMMNYSSASQKIWDTYVASKDFGDAANFYAAMAKIYSNDKNVWSRLAYSLNELKNYNGVLEAYNHDANSYAKLANLYQSMKAYDKAEEIYKRAIEHNFGSFDDGSIITKSIYGTAGHENTIVYNSGAKEELAFMYFSTAQYEKAVKMCQEILNANSNSDNYPYLCLLADSYAHLKDYNSAIEMCQKAIAIEPKAKVTVVRGDMLLVYCNTPYAILGTVYYETEDYNNAIESFTKAISIDPKNPISAPSNDELGYFYHYWRGRCYEKKNDYDSALKDYDKILELDPKNKEAEKNRNRLLERMKKN